MGQVDEAGTEVKPEARFLRLSKPERPYLESVGQKGKSQECPSVFQGAEKTSFCEPVQEEPFLCQIWGGPNDWVSSDCEGHEGCGERSLLVGRRRGDLGGISNLRGGPSCS